MNMSVDLPLYKYNNNTRYEKFSMSFNVLCSEVIYYSNLLYIFIFNNFETNS